LFAVGEPALPQPVLIGLGAVLPAAMLWQLAAVLGTDRRSRAETAALRAALDDLRKAQAERPAPVTQPAAARVPAPPRPAPAPAPDPAPVAPVANTDEAQGHLELGPPPDDLGALLSHDDFIRALNFPETAQDTDGFAALRRAMGYRKAAQLIQAAEDVLTLLSQQGIYMDDLVPQPAPAATWRRFAIGERGEAVRPLGGIDDAEVLETATARMREDPIFRDVAHHFLRRFDQVFAEFEPDATDSEVTALADTRTARAFMLLGRASGSFD
jgi:hypothetical protein